MELPGRWTRLREPAFTEMTPLVEALFSGLGELFDRPFAFFGYSIGALVAFELARLTRRRRQVLPVHLFAASRRAPQIPDPLALPRVQTLSDAQLVDGLVRLYDGIPAAVRENAELLAITLPILRADLRVLESYGCADEPPLACSLTALGGDSDPSTSRTDLEAWRQQTSGHFSLRLFPGGHFFMQSTPKPVLELVAHELSPF